jgi:hypothetical protein
MRKSSKLCIHYGGKPNAKPAFDPEPMAEVVVARITE